MARERIDKRSTYMLRVEDMSANMSAKMAVAVAGRDLYVTGPGCQGSFLLVATVARMGVSVGAWGEVVEAALASESETPVAMMGRNAVARWGGKTYIAEEC